MHPHVYLVSYSLQSLQRAHTVKIESLFFLMSKRQNFNKNGDHVTSLLLCLVEKSSHNLLFLVPETVISSHPIRRQSILSPHCSSQRNSKVFLCSFYQRRESLLVMHIHYNHDCIKLLNSLDFNV